MLSSLSFLLYITNLLSRHFWNIFHQFYIIIFIVHIIHVHIYGRALPISSLFKDICPLVKVEHCIGARCCTGTACSSGFVGVAIARKIVREGRRRAFRALAHIESGSDHVFRAHAIFSAGHREELLAPRLGTLAQDLTEISQHFLANDTPRQDEFTMSLWFLCNVFSNDARIPNVRPFFHEKIDVYPRCRKTSVTRFFYKWLNFS